MGRRAWIVLGCLAVACNAKREPPHSTPGSGTGTGASGGGWPYSSTTTVQPSTGPGPQPANCFCIYASAHVDACSSCFTNIGPIKCSNEWNACQGDPSCQALLSFCVSEVANDGGMIDTCLGQPGPTRDRLEAYFACVCSSSDCSGSCEPGKQCGGEGGAGSTSASSASSTTASSTASSTTASTAASAGTGGASSSSTGP